MQMNIVNARMTNREVAPAVMDCVPTSCCYCSIIRARQGGRHNEF